MCWATQAAATPQTGHPHTAPLPLHAVQPALHAALYHAHLSMVHPADAAAAAAERSHCFCVRHLGNAAVDLESETAGDAGGLNRSCWGLRALESSVALHSRHSTRSCRDTSSTEGCQSLNAVLDSLACGTGQHGAEAAPRSSLQNRYPQICVIHISTHTHLHVCLMQQVCMTGSVESCVASCGYLGQVRGSGGTQRGRQGLSPPTRASISAWCLLRRTGSRPVTTTMCV